jgi:hypothetical protein
MLRAHFALFLEFRDGRIVRQRNYDCFEAWHSGPTRMKLTNCLAVARSSSRM